MKLDSRYVQNEAVYLRYSEDALAHCFVSSSEFQLFYSRLPNEMAKNEFLRVASFYLFLVREGDWVSSLNEERKVIDYLTNSYKLVGLFSLIESLSDGEHQNFHSYVCSLSKKSSIFPIESKGALELLFKQYNYAHGATNFCVAFFGRLPPPKQTELMQRIRVQRKPVSTLKRAVQVLYGLRSRFVHEGGLLGQLSDRPVASVMNKKIVLFDLSFSKIADLFEQALLLHFAGKHSIPLQQVAKEQAFAVR